MERNSMTPILFIRDCDEQNLIDIHQILSSAIYQMSKQGKWKGNQEYRKRFMIENFLRMVRRVNDKETVECLPVVSVSDLQKLNLNQLLGIIDRYPMFHSGFCGNLRKKSDIAEFIVYTQSTFFLYCKGLVAFNMEKIKEVLCPNI